MRVSASASVRTIQFRAGIGNIRGVNSFPARPESRPDVRTDDVGDDVLCGMGRHGGDEALAPVEPSEDQGYPAVSEKNMAAISGPVAPRRACLPAAGESHQITDLPRRFRTRALPAPDLSDEPTLR